MPTINRASVFYPPQFPVQGRLPSRELALYQNRQTQIELETEYRDALAKAAGRRGIPPCSRTLHVTLCFDGTGNNLNNDLYLADPKHPTNIARMFRASIGDGYAGGTAHSPGADRLTDAPGIGRSQYFKYYMPGVGTPFPEIGDLDYSLTGLGLASLGEERINWGLMMIIDALRRALGLPRQDNSTLRAAVKAMGSVHGFESVTGKANRRRIFYTHFWPLLPALRRATSANGGECRLLGVKLYIYGFSRGAAAARGFVSWLHELLSPTEEKTSLKFGDVALPIHVQYLGLLDTVASVGIADILPVANGHMGWADGNQHIPEGDFVRRCLHIVASHEQRQCFPSESIRREDGSYPPNCTEVIYPGVHSDQGGGYPPGDQGKGFHPDPRVGDGLLLSQIALHDLYADAFANGAPLKVPKGALPVEWSSHLWRAMPDELELSFGVAPTLGERFNAWRQVTLGLAPSTQPLPIERAERYAPVTAGTCIEDALRDQLTWITAWRIDRYAFSSLLKTPFYLAARDTEADPQVRRTAKEARNKKQGVIEKQRVKQRMDELQPNVKRMPMLPGIKDFDALMDQTQLREAAEEFAEHYRQDLVQATFIWATSTALPGNVGVDRGERIRMKSDGLEKVRALFPRPANLYQTPPEEKRGEVDESRSAGQPEGLLRDLFDDQVHDSRAWFMYSPWGREPWGSYLSDRMVFFGGANSRMLTVLDERDLPVLAGDPRLPGTVASVETPPTIMTPERLAEIHKAIDANWATHEAEVRGVTDVSV
jgi:hypothetical protein